MHVQRLILHHIRSYTHADLTFSDGIVMLSGDIGSGKSTILLAIEFALFGLLRGELTGDALLRHGAREGSVELTFTIGENTYTIKRALKRTKKSVEQDAGYLITNGTKQVGTATELKSHILTLLGYPQELLTKSKNFIYRYTVYTPQENMKRILLEDADQRVATLRTVFDIDKYERITKNANNYAKALRERKRALDAVLSDLQEKQEHAERTRKEFNDAKKAAAELHPQVDAARQQLKQAQESLATFDKQRQQAEQLTRDLHVTKTQLASKQQQHQQITQDLKDITAKLALVEDITPVDTTALAAKKTELTNTITKLEQDAHQATIKLTELNTLKQQASQAQQNIAQLSTCPTCKQDVPPDHKHSIISTEQQRIADLAAQAAQHQHTIKQHNEQKTALKAELDKLHQQEQQAAVANLKVANAQELHKRKSLLEEQQKTVVTEISSHQDKLATIETHLTPLKDITAQYQQAREHTLKLQEQERQLTITHTSLVQKQEHLTNTLQLLEKDIAHKLNAKKRLERTQHIHQWLSDYFTPLMATIEQHVMAKIHHEFDALFQQWFGILIEDTMTARLDETFTPIISQNGYETSIEHLSGGEKTACALAYRLALNKTINSLISTIKTKNLLILDEPTDGFSAEQLDNMRDVLDQLNLNQTIIVSHEQKIESFADHIIRVTKRDHNSSIA